MAHAIKIQRLLQIAFQIAILERLLSNYGKIRGFRDFSQKFRTSLNDGINSRIEICKEFHGRCISEIKIKYKLF
jgi:hypothetical protein